MDQSLCAGGCQSFGVCAPTEFVCINRVCVHQQSVCASTEFVCINRVCVLEGASTASVCVHQQRANEQRRPAINDAGRGCWAGLWLFRHMDCNSRHANSPSVSACLCSKPKLACLSRRWDSLKQPTRLLGQTRRKKRLPRVSASLIGICQPVKGSGDEGFAGGGGHSCNARSLLPAFFLFACE